MGNHRGSGKGSNPPKVTQLGRGRTWAFWSICAPSPTHHQVLRSHWPWCCPRGQRQGLNLGRGCAWAAWRPGEDVAGSAHPQELPRMPPVLPRPLLPGPPGSLGASGLPPPPPQTRPCQVLAFPSFLCRQLHSQTRRAPLSPPGLRPPQCPRDGLPHPLLPAALAPAPAPPQCCPSSARLPQAPIPLTPATYVPFFSDPWGLIVSPPWGRGLHV